MEIEMNKQKRKIKSPMGISSFSIKDVKEAVKNAMKKRRTRE